MSPRTLTAPPRCPVDVSRIESRPEERSAATASVTARCFDLQLPDLLPLFHLGEGLACAQTGRTAHGHL